jgi:uncharacterized protein YcbX
MEPLYIPLVPQYPLEKVENVTCWEWSGTALSEGVDAAEWVSKFLGKPASLVRFDTGREDSCTPFVSVIFEVSFCEKDELLNCVLWL